MSHRTSFSLLAAALVAAASSLSAQEPQRQLKVTNELDRARASATVEIPAADLTAVFRAEDLARLRVTDAVSRQELLAQPVDDDGDGTFDRVVFQAEFGGHASRTFVLALGSKRVLQKQDFRVYGRFVRERFDDFAWENDLVAHRVYGPALETWQKEPLTSSGVDVWVKRTRALVVNDWYMVDDYHHDRGEGGDFYSVGPSRGCGGSGIWQDGRLAVSRNFRDSRVLANGPIRLVFELQYAPWEAGGVKVSERKRITLDAGSHFNRIESTYTVEGASEVAWAAGIKKAKGADVRVQRDKGTLRTWEALSEPNGHLGCALVVAPGLVQSTGEADNNVLLIGKTGAARPVVYYAGSGWDKGGDVAGVAAWDTLVDDLAERLRSPLRIEILP
jgi:unsaturated rhamnogalacturonyl hydrolase